MCERLCKLPKSRVFRVKETVHGGGGHKAERRFRSLGRLSDAALCQRGRTLGGFLQRKKMQRGGDLRPHLPDMHSTGSGRTPCPVELSLGLVGAHSPLALLRLPPLAHASVFAAVMSDLAGLPQRQLLH